MTKLDIKIYYKDTDCGGVVYYANYLDYFERGRTEYMASRGIDVGGEASRGIFFVVRRAEVDYISPARYGDIITVETEIEKISGASLSFTYLITCDSGLRQIVRGRTLLACINETMHPRRLPVDVAARLSDN